MKLVTWHSSDGKLGDDETIAAWAAFKYWTFLKRSDDVFADIVGRIECLEG
jgi:hypothetical protein